MQNEGYEVIPVASADYSPTLKTNLKATASPPVLYIKGNRKILYERSIAIVGSRNAADISLQFTDNIAKLASKEYKVVVSGFAKGVDKQALDSALKYKGQSIIVLPQGIMTFGSGFQKYYRQIVDGDLLVLSVFQPKAPWQASLAMARNAIIYGLAAEIFVAESSGSGGTWSGAIDGLRKGRKTFIRKPEPNEKNANELLIKKGAIPVDMEGKVVIEDIRVKEAELFSQVKEPAVTYERNILALLSKGSFSSGELIRYLKLEMTEQSLTELLSNHTGVETLNEHPPRFRLKSGKPKQTKLF
jgi:predicted Rossmann fold nucleotide-binding protein DprA/Smf involved in DNA uptake